MKNEPTNELSSGQYRAFEAVAHFVRQGITPTVPEVMRQLKLKKESGLTPTLEAIHAKGHIIIRGGQGYVRTLDLTPLGTVEAGIGFPVFGAIPAGPASEAVQEWMDVVNPGNALRGQKGDFFLVVKGDSMIGDGIMSGDRVLLRPDVQINSGEIAAVLIAQDNGQFESTLKHVKFLYATNEVVLQASNPDYEDRIVKQQDIKIAGAYRGLYRNLS
jgi:repressor LexA